MLWDYPDYKESVRWFRLAAEQGDSRAQYKLGSLYEVEQGVPSSRVIAYAFMNISALSEFYLKFAEGDRDRLIKKLSSKEIEEGQALSREMIKPGNLLKALDAYVAKKGE